MATRPARILRTFQPAPPNAVASTAIGCERISEGAIAILTACLLNVIVGACFFLARKTEPGFSPSTGIFLRVMANFSCLLFPWAMGSTMPRLRALRGHKALWLWAALGVCTTSAYFFAISLSPVGLVNFLNSGSGIFIAAMAPLLARQATTRAEWIGALGSIFGIFLLSDPSASGLSPLGALLAVLSGLTSGLAYLMIARTRGRGYGPGCIMLHWSVANAAVYAAVVLFTPAHWPTHVGTWLLLLIAGFSAAWSQWFTTRAFRLAPASLIACLCYVGTVLSVAVDAFVFDLHYPPLALLGATIVLSFGCALPLWRRLRTS